MLMFYNTLTGKKEEFTAIHNGEARLYHCGPTVYNFAHIGNLRAYVFADVLRRTLEYSGFTVKQVINITDIGHLSSDGDEGEDKMMKALAREGRPVTMEAMKELAGKYEQAFRENLVALNIKTEGTAFPRASENIKEDAEIIDILLKKGVAYKTSDGIYFDTAQFPAYGTQGGFTLGNLKEGARVAVNTEKRNPRDFALWKFSKGDLGFPASYGHGFPGWHIECSAMSRKYLGQPFDIHTGGIDHVPVHHQNEIAQSEAAYGTPLAHYWMHSEFVNVPDGSKMAKSEENFLTLHALAEKGIHPLAYRYFLLGAHYRSPLAFSWDALQAAQNALFAFLLTANTPTERIRRAGYENWSRSSWEKEVDSAVADDLNTPKLIDLMHEALANYDPKDIARWELINKVDRILGIGLYEMAEELDAVPDDIKEKAAIRETMRRAKDFTTADTLRAEIQTAGYSITDTNKGPIVWKSIL